MPKPRKPRDRSLAAALELEEPWDFMWAVQYMDEKHNGMAFRARPDPLRMLGGLATLYFDVKMEGIWKFIDQHKHQAEFEGALAAPARRDGSPEHWTPGTHS